MENDNEFWKQFSGSATANIVVIILYGIAKFLQSRCKHSRCSSDNSCFKCKIDNENTIRDPIERGNHKDVRSEESLQELSTTVHSEVSKRHQSIV